MMWNISFISEKDFKNHVKKTIQTYGNKLEAFDLKKFNSNIIDPIKLIFDKTVYHYSWEQIISNEIFRQRDKSNNNEIGYFHQNIFSYFPNCHVPQNGQEGGWDIIYESPAEIKFDDISVHKIYVELKNKHNTMNSSSSAKTYMKMQNKLLHEKDCACFLVETIAKKSQNIIWKVTVDKNKMACDYIRRVSMDKFYELVTGEKDAFYKICLVLPECIQQIVDEEKYRLVPKDTVFEELQALAQKNNINDENFAMIMALYMLGFSTYNGFNIKNRL